MPSELGTIRQRRLSLRLGRDWYEVAQEERRRGQTLRQIAERFSSVEGIPMHYATLAGWLSARRKAEEEVQAA